MKGFAKKVICTVIALALFVGAVPALADESPKAASSADVTEPVLTSGTDYSEYIAAYSSGKINKNGEDIVLSGAQPAEKSPNAQIVSDVCGTGKGGTVIPDDGYALWNINVNEDSLYTVRVNYAAAKEGSGNLEQALKIDGKTPFRQATVLSFRRSYEQDISNRKTTVTGNDMKPEVKEITVWRDGDLSDASGHRLIPFEFYFSKGDHTLTFEGSRGEMAISSITLTPYKAPISYKEYKSGFGKDNAKGEKQIVIEGEDFREKSSVTILPKSDKSSPATTPQSATALKLNTVGGECWKTTGDSVTWDITVPKSGVYEIALRFRQNLKDGIYTNRKLYIDGKVPFAEAEFLRFRYSSKWQSAKLGNSDGDFSFYLSKGKHTITLEAGAGEIAEIVGTIQNSVTELNRIYRRIFMITGTNPDTNRDYNFAALIPDEIKQMKEIKIALQESVDFINEQAGANGSYVSIIQKIIFQLEQMTDKPRYIAKYLSRFKSNLGAMSEWLMTAAEQPLEIDKITVLPAGGKTPSANAGFFKNLAFSVKCFLNSYVTDYNSIGTSGNAKSGKKLKVWIQTGRDQGEIIRDLINISFAEKCDSVVDLEIVPGTLLNSVLAGIAPDVVMDNASSNPMDFAIRNAVVDLKEFDDYDEVMKRFPAAAIKPAEFNGKVYGMPQTFSFPMFFYRTDIFEEYGYTVPKTWKELCEMIPSMQRNKLEVGVANMYTTFLYQRGGEYYRENGKYCNLDDPVTIEAFADFTDMFTLYDCPINYNFANRFRNGEMPCGVEDYSVYNTLTAFAPEIKGLWEMVPIPGTADENGKINNVAVGSSMYIMMMSTSKNRQAAWEFMKWFTSTDIQVEYAYRMESILGNCAKVSTANTEALSKMSWSSKEFKNLSAQLKNVDSVPNVPGSYYLSRVIGFATSRVYNNMEDPAETLTGYVKEFNDELARKRAEFGLDD